MAEASLADGLEAGLDLEIVVEETEVDGLEIVVEIVVDSATVVSVIVVATVIAEDIVVVAEATVSVVEEEVKEAPVTLPVVDQAVHMVDPLVQIKMLLVSMVTSVQILEPSKSCFIPKRRKLPA